MHPICTALVGILTVFATGAHSATIKATFSGSVESSFDRTGEFGKKGETLDGQIFKLTFLFDTSLGLRQTGPGYDNVYGNSASNMPSPILQADLEIAGVSRSFLTQPSAISSEGGAYVQEQTSDYAGSEANGIFAVISASYFAQPFPDYDFDYGDEFGNYVPKRYVDASITSDFWTVFKFGRRQNIRGYSYYPGVFQIFEIGETPENYRLAYGRLNVDMLRVQPIPQVPLPASAPMLLGALVAFGAIKLRRKRLTFVNQLL